MTATSEPGRWSQATIYADMWVDPDDDPRETIEATNDERGTLLAYLKQYRLTFEMKCAGLDAEQMALRSVPPSTMSLLGMVRHLAGVEHNWFRRELAGQDVPRLFREPDDQDADWNGAVADAAVVVQAWAAWRAEVDFAEEFVASTADLGTLGVTGWPLRKVLVHMIE